MLRIGTPCLGVAVSRVGAGAAWRARHADTTCTMTQFWEPSAPPRACVVPRPGFGLPGGRERKSAIRGYEHERGRCQPRLHVSEERAIQSRT